MKKAIVYYRVSTEKQLKARPGQSTQSQKPREKTGLGLEAQQAAVSRYVQQEGYTVIAPFTEVESGKKNDRPELLAALALCRKERATLIIATLTRLSRNVAFIANLMESKVQFKTVDDPYADDLTIHIRAAFAQHERKEISKRTKAALGAAKDRGTVLGRYGRDVLSKQNAAAAKQFAETMRPTIKQLQNKGFKTVRAIRDELNRQQIPTYRQGKRWHETSVHAILKRLENRPNIRPNIRSKTSADI